MCWAAFYQTESDASTILKTKASSMKYSRKIVARLTLASLALFAVLFSLSLINFGGFSVGVLSTQALAFALATPSPCLFMAALTEDQVREFEGIIRGLKEYDDLFPALKDLYRDEGGFAAIKELPTVIRNLRKDLDDHRRQDLARHSGSRAAAPGRVSDDCAAYMTAIYIAAAEKQGKLEIVSGKQRDALLSEAKSILRVESRTALTSSDIPLPTGYSGEVVQLVSQYGAARKYGTVFPLGTGVTKLPRLKTDTAFGLLTQSQPVTEKSPQTEWVTFTAEKFGGLIRLPSEIEEDSIVPMGQWLADYCARNIAKVEDQVYFMNLDGATYGAVKGLCGSTIDNSKVVQMAATKTHYSDATLTNVRALRGVVDAPALSQGAYYMHPSFEQLLNTFNSAGDRPYNPSAQLAIPDASGFGRVGPKLDGFEIRWGDSMPAYSTSVNASKVFMLFGDLRYQYLGARPGIRFDISRDAAFETDETLYRAIERFTIGLMATGAVGGLQTAAA